MPTEIMDPTELIRRHNEAESPRAAAEVEAEVTVRERLLAMPAELLNAGYVTLCSIWPERLTSQCFHHGGAGRKFYTIPPGSATEPSYLLLQNTYDIVLVQEGMDKGYAEKVIRADQIAVDLIMYWTGDHPANVRGKKGVGVIKGKMVDGKVRATPEEITALKKQQDGFLQFLVDRADDFWMKGDRGKIQKEHKLAVRYLGLDEKSHLWINDTIQKHVNCPWCGDRVPIEAIVCKTGCRRDIAPYYVERDLQAEGWPAVMAEIERLTKKKKGTKDDPSKNF